ncbi:Rep family protein [Streptococcus marmotae]|uniref:Rep family protein n=1 Tax=Streptococcus marmotae TaxID=1825069 RepID=UPI0008376547|nr:Rep family protein [Streptococcus marmotae]
MTERIRSRNHMYVQQLEYLKHKDVKRVVNDITTILAPKKWAYIIHDKDKDKDETGKLKTAHIHLVMEFENALSPKSLAKQIDEQNPQTFRVLKGKVNNAYAYLIHEHSTGKYKYPIEDVISNFDYATLIDEIRTQASQAKRKNDREFIDDLLNQIYEGTLSIEEAEKLLSGSQYAKNVNKLKAVAFKHQQSLSAQFVQKQREKNQPKEIIWIFGESGVGKTRLAKHYAEQQKDDYFISGSSKDTFQNYKNETVVILDELRPSTFRYEDLLKILDPYNFESFVPSRYFDKALTANIIIITSPFSPKELYDDLVAYKSKDGFEQLNRRITSCIKMDNLFINHVEYFEWRTHMATYYSYNVQKRIPNPFAKQAETVKQTNLFNKIEQSLIVNTKEVDMNGSNTVGTIL